MMCVKSTVELNSMIEAARQKANMSQEALALNIGLKGHSAISRKLRGKSPWSLKQLALVSELLNLPDLAQPLPVYKDKVSLSPGIKTLVDILNRVSPKTQMEIMYVASLILEGKAETKKLWTQVKALRAFTHKTARRSPRQP